MTDLYDKSVHYITAQLQDLRKFPKEEKRTGRPFVTVSRESGAYGMTIAEMLAAYLQGNERRDGCPWTVFDKTLLQRVMEEHHLPEKFSQYLDEKPARVIEDALEEMLGVHPARETLVRKMNETIYHLAQLGYVILVGRGAHLITRQLAKGLHVRLAGSLEKRVRHMREYLKADEKRAREHVLREEKERREYIRKYFGKDPGDPSLYDLVINTDTVAPEDAVHMIGELVLRGRRSVPG